jgi:hypothetical protein
MPSISTQQAVAHSPTTEMTKRKEGRSRSRSRSQSDSETQVII